jgi:DNA-binding transcriptional LysR family regulator
MDLLDQMATFVRVFDSGSFSAAARQLRLSPAAVSRQIAALENEVRAPLMTRSTRRMAVTPAGRRFYERCVRILREVEAARGVGRGDPLAGLLQVSASVTFGLALVVPHLPALMALHPGLLVDLRLEDRLTDLVSDGIDVAIRVGSAPPDSAELVAHRLFSFRRVVVAAPAYLKRRGEPKTPEALGRHQALTYLDGPGAEHWRLANGEREVQTGLEIVFRCNALHAQRALAVAGKGVALLPTWLVTEEVRRRALRIVLPGWNTGPVHVHAIHRAEQRGAPRIRALVDHLRAVYARTNG